MGGIETTEFLGVGFAKLKFRKACDAVIELSKRDQFTFVVTPNVDHINMLNGSRDVAISANLKAAYREASLILCDSRVLARIARFFGHQLHVVPGSDLTAMLFKMNFGDAKKIAIIGGDKDTLAGIGRLLPKIELVQHIPPMRLASNQDAIRAAAGFAYENQADFTLFAVGCPQSEMLALSTAKLGRGRGVGLCIGASVDFLLGRQTRAPGWVRKLGLEWMHRLAKEPRRLWRRYLIDGPRIFMTAIKWSRVKRPLGNAR